MSYQDYMTGMQADDDSLDTSEIIDAYERGIRDLDSALEGMSQEQARARPIAGKWSTVEVVAHLSGCEIYFVDRIERTLAMDNPLLISVDEKPYPARLSFQELDLEEEFALFTALRRHTARVLRMQPPEAWHRTGVHSGTGILTVRQLVLQPIRHLRHHLPFIAEKRAALASRK